MHETSKLIHLFAAIYWLGGMWAMLGAVRPAVIAQHEGMARLRTLHAVLRRFFLGVWVSVALILATGLHLYGSGAITAAAARRASGMVSGPLLPLGWNLMMGMGLLMVLIYAHIYFAGFRKLDRAMAANDAAGATQALSSMHPLMLTNAALGALAVAAVKLL